MHIPKFEEESHFHKDEFFERIDYDKDTFAELLKVSIDQLDKDINLLIEKIENESIDSIHGLAHKIKGTCRTVSFNRLSKYSEAIEHAADDSIIPENAKLLIKQEWDIVSDKVKEVLRNE